jgi:signal peptidase I
VNRKTGGEGEAGAASGSRAAEDVEGNAPETLVRRIWDQVAPVGVAVAIALLIRAMVIESYYVPSESMLPTLLIGDHVFVNKFVYGAKVPFVDVRLPAVRDPERGEIVVFALGRRGPGQICPLDECPDYPAEGFVKRIVALPGDKVEYRGAALFVNDQRVPWVDTTRTFQDEAAREYQLIDEQLPDCTHQILEHPRMPGLSHQAYTVPPGRYYFLGDNRDNSNDSRAWGTVRREELKGPVIVNYWSWNNQESWLAMLNPLTWLRLLWSEMRWGRIGMTYSCE